MRQENWEKYTGKSSLALSFFKYGLPAGALAVLGVNIALHLSKENEAIASAQILNDERSSYASLDADKKTSDIDLQPMP